METEITKDAAAVILKIAAERVETLNKVRQALIEGDEDRALNLMRDLVGLNPKPGAPNA